MRCGKVVTTKILNKSCRKCFQRSSKEKSNMISIKNVLVFFFWTKDLLNSFRMRQHFVKSTRRHQITYYLPTKQQTAHLTVKLHYLWLLFVFIFSHTYQDNFLFLAIQLFRWKKEIYSVNSFQSTETFEMWYSWMDFADWSFFWYNICFLLRKWIGTIYV